ncbi:MAG: hypothetical protein RSB90_10315 [Eubacterium sp.]
MGDYKVVVHAPARIPDEQARLVAEMIIDFYKDEKNLKEFEEWKAKRE